MVDRHIRTTQRAPSIKEVITRIEKAIETETNPEGRALYERALDYWKNRRKEGK